MSSIEPATDARSLLVEWVAANDGGYAELSRQLGGTPTAEALRLFADGAVRSPRYLPALLDLLQGRHRAKSLAQEAAEALALIRQGEAALQRVASRLLELSDDDRRSIAAADAPMPDAAGQDRRPTKRKRGRAS